MVSFFPLTHVLNTFHRLLMCLFVYDIIVFVMDNRKKKKHLNFTAQILQTHKYILFFH